MFNKVVESSRPVSPLAVQVTEYQPIISSQTTSGVRVLSPTARARGGRDGEGQSRTPGSPSLVLVLIRTFGARFMLSVAFKLVSDVLQFANPLILK